MPSTFQRNLPAIIAVAIGTALRTSHWNLILMIAMYYLRPYLIQQRDDRERQQLAAKIKEESEAKSMDSQSESTNR